MADTCVVYRLGLVPYAEAWELQGKMVADVTDGSPPATLLLLEHPHTYTFGRRGKKDNLIWDVNELERRDVDVHWVDRGGDVTYHGPGQIVGYPIIPLSCRRVYQSQNYKDNKQILKADYIGYLRDLEEVIIQTLAEMDVSAERLNGATGVWVQPEAISNPRDPTVGADHKPAKIAAIGVKVDVNGISKHGFAFNVNPDMRFWDGIVACGLADYPVTSLAEIVQPVPSMERVFQAIESSFARIFNYDMTPGF